MLILLQAPNLYCNPSKSLLGIETHSQDTSPPNITDCNPSKSLLGIETWVLAWLVDDFAIAIHQNPY